MSRNRADDFQTGLAGRFGTPTERKSHLMSPTARRVLSLIAVICTLAVVADVVQPARSTLPSNPLVEAAATTYGVSGSTVPLIGAGYGHGRGMSQYGARGAASSGLTAAQILDFYYPGTAAATLPARNIRVLLSADEGTDVLVLPSEGLAVYDAATRSRVSLPSGPTHWRIVSLSTGRLQVQAKTSGAWAAFDVAGQTSLAGPVHFTGTDFVKVVFPDSAVRGYRAEVIAYALGPGRLQTVNMLPFEDYLRGVVPKESPSFWPAAALQAQAVAARSYSENKRVRSTATNYDICDTTACQVYGGARTYDANGTQTGSVETASTDAAIQATAYQVRTYSGAAILAEFSSSNGGHTAGGSLPYFSQKPDPYEAAGSNPNASWSAGISVRALQSAFPAVGRLTGITIATRYGGGEWGGRVGDVVLRGIDDAGKATSIETTGARLRTIGALKSTYFTIAGRDPRGSLDGVGPDRAYTGEVTVRGWAFDDDAPSTSLRVHVYVNGRGAHSVLADQPRPDVGAAYPQAGDAHGFAVTTALTPGTHDVCVYAINVGSGSDKSLGCTSVTVLEASPFGSVDEVGPALTSGAVTLRGWALDPSEPARSLAVHVYVDGRGVANVPADRARPDVGAAYPGAGDLHGFSVPLSLSAGRHQVCAFAINVGLGSNKLLRCSSIDVLGPNPVGQVDRIAPSVANDGRFTVQGWAVDPDDPTRPLEVHVYVNGRGYGAYSTGVARDDVVRAYPGTGSAPGYSIGLRLSSGSHQVCIYAINVGPGSHTLQRCATVRVEDRGVVGSVDGIARAGAGQVRVRGWTIDPDTRSIPTPVHVYVDGRGAGAFTAADSRPDVAAAYPGAGDEHGFSLLLNVAPGRRTVCVFGISTGGIAPGTLMRCSTIDV
jgi:SpoIID/LytB domain protein